MEGQTCITIIWLLLLRTVAPSVGCVLEVLQKIDLHRSPSTSPTVAPSVECSLWRYTKKGWCQNRSVAKKMVGLFCVAPSVPLGFDSDWPDCRKAEGKPRVSIFRWPRPKERPRARRIKRYKTAPRQGPKQQNRFNRFNQTIKEDLTRPGRNFAISLPRCISLSPSPSPSPSPL